jgi:prolyl oligopeptidase PreP (S9A serine peptidase family)
MLYVVICIALAMAGVAGMQFFYLAYMERIVNQQKKRVTELERQNAVLYHRWQDAERVAAHYQDLEAEVVEEEEEVWSEIIDSEQ